MAYKLVFIIWSFDFLKSLEFRRFNAFGSKKYIKTIILWIINIINILFLFEYILSVNYCCDAKLNFQHHYFSVTFLQKSF